MKERDWTIRRMAAAQRLYDTALGQIDPNDRGRFFADSDMVGWYLFLAEAYVDHIWNYEPMYGSRVVPVIAAIGRNLSLLQTVSGLEERVARLLNSERRQPNGGLFELLVAAGYLRSGAEVLLLPEQPGRARTHDMDVRIDRTNYAVECKRMETGAYGDGERTRVRELWGPSCAGLTEVERSALCDVRFLVPVEDVPRSYLTERTHSWLDSDLPTLLWDDEFGHGRIGDLDLQPLQNELAHSSVLAAGTRMQELLTGSYVRNAPMVIAQRIKPASHNPRYADECDLAIVLRWASESERAIDLKARDVFGKVVEANDQLPTARPGLIHVGFEAVEGDNVERVRFQKILSRLRHFDPKGKDLEGIYCHYFVPESPPDESWAYDETTQYIGRASQQPLRESFLVLPSSAGARLGAHFDR